MTIASSTWRSLSTVTQNAWSDYASQISRSDSLGSSYNPTGASFFSGCVIASDGPGFASDPPAVLPSYVLQITAIAYVDPTPGPEALNVSLALTSTDSSMIIETSGPVSAGITSAAAVRRWRTLPDSALDIRKNFYAMTASPTDIIAEYKFLFPSPVTGNNIYFRFTEVFSDGVATIGIPNRSRQTFRLIIP